jgi:hypothetical protein
VNPLKLISGIILAMLSTALGFISFFLVGGLGICGFNLAPGMIYFALFCAAALPGVTARLLPIPWWLPAIFFVGFFPLGVFFQVLGQEWNRALVSSGCIVIAMVSAWLGQPRRRSW